MNRIARWPWPPSAPAKEAHEYPFHNSWKNLGNTICKTLFQSASASISFAQLYADEYQNTFNKSRLPGRANVPNRLFRVFLSARVIGLSIAARLYSPEIDPCYCARIVFPEGEYTKGGETGAFFYNENVLETHDL